MNSWSKYSIHPAKRCYEIFKELIDREKRATIPFDFLNAVQEANINPLERESVICDLLQISENLELSENTKHIAVKCFDIVLSKEKIEKPIAGYIAVACLCIAAKFEGDSVNKVAQYRHSVLDSVRGSGLDLNELELSLMQLLDWNVSFVTPPEVAQCVISILGLRKEQAVALESHTSKIINFSITGVDYQFCKYEPSIIAISSVLASAEIQGLFDLRDKLIRKIYRTCDDEYIEKLCECKRMLCMLLAPASSTEDADEEVGPTGHFIRNPMANHIQPLEGDEANIDECNCSVDLYAPPEDLAFALYGSGKGVYLE